MSFKEIKKYPTIQAPSSGGHTQPAELILCTSSFKRTTFKKPDAARLPNKNYNIIFANCAKRKEKGGDNRGQRWRLNKKENKQPERGAH